MYWRDKSEADQEPGEPSASPETMNCFLTRVCPTSMSQRKGKPKRAKSGAHESSAKIPHPADLDFGTSSAADEGASKTKNPASRKIEMKKI